MNSGILITYVSQNSRNLYKPFCRVNFTYLLPTLTRQLRFEIKKNWHNGTYNSLLSSNMSGLNKTVFIMFCPHSCIHGDGWVSFSTMSIVQTKTERVSGLYDRGWSKQIFTYSVQLYDSSWKWKKFNLFKRIYEYYISLKINNMNWIR